MIKTRMVALFTSVMMLMVSCSGTPAYAQESEAVLAAEAKDKETETDGKTEADGTKDSGNGAEILGAVPLDASVMTRLTAGMDPEIVEVLLENPKLMALIMPTLHVTVTDTAVKIAFKEETAEPVEPVLMGTVRTNSGSLNVRTGAGKSNAVISQLKNGTEVKVLGEKDGWYEIEIPSEYAYVCGKYLEVHKITPEKTEEGYTFDIDGETMLGFLRMFEDLFKPEPEPVPAGPAGLTPAGNLSLVDDIGPVNGVGQQFLTMVSKNGNYFYMVIDRNDKGEENVHLLNLVDERDLMDLMAKDDKGSYEAITEAEKKAAEEKAQAEKEAAEKAAAEAKEKEKSEKEGKNKVNLLPAFLVLPVLAAVAGAWVYLQTKKQKKDAASPDPDAGYEEEEGNEEEDYAAGEEEPDNAEEETDSAEEGPETAEDEADSDDVSSYENDPGDDAAGDEEEL